MLQLPRLQLLQGWEQLSSQIIFKQFAKQPLHTAPSGPPSTSTCRSGTAPSVTGWAASGIPASWIPASWIPASTPPSVAGGRQRPLWQVSPLQHSEVAAQPVPCIEQIGSGRQIPPAHSNPARQSAAAVQVA